MSTKKMVGFYHGALAEFMDHEAVPEKYLYMEALGYEYLSEGDGNPRHDTLWIDVEEV